MRHRVLLILTLLLPMLASAGPLEIVKQSGLKGGLVVHAGCGDGAVTASLRINDQILVQGLDKNVEPARELLLQKKMHGPVSVVQWGGGALPYNDNLVNLLFIEEGIEVSRQEILRVLAPGGAAHVSQGSGWTNTTVEVPTCIWGEQRVPGV